MNKVTEGLKNRSQTLSEITSITSEKKSWKIPSDISCICIKQCGERTDRAVFKKKYLKLLLVLGSTGDGRHGAIVSAKQQTVDQVSFLSNGFFNPMTFTVVSTFYLFYCYPNSPSYFVDFILEKDTIKQKQKEHGTKQQRLT